MRGSTIVTLVAGAIFAAVAVVVFRKYWPGLEPESKLIKAILVGLAAYGGAMGAQMIGRIVDPTLPMPALAWIIYFLWAIAEFFGATKTEEQRRREADEAAYGPRPTEPEESSKFGKQGTGMVWACFLTFIALVMYGGGVGFAYWLGKKHLEAPVAKPQIKEPPPSKPVTPDKPSAPDNPAPVKSSEITDQADLIHAIAYSARDYSDHEPSDGSRQLAKWLATKGKWNDVFVARNETSIELVEKDWKKARGNRLCVAGTLERIEKDGDLYAARLVTAEKDAVEMLAVGNTGNLVKRKPAKFCGVVTGMKSGATFAVGMFDTNK